MENNISHLKTWEHYSEKVACKFDHCCRKPIKYVSYLYRTGVAVNTTSNFTKMAVDEAMFQVILWSSIGLGVALVGAVAALVSMDPTTDKLIYAADPLKKM